MFRDDTVYVIRVADAVMVEVLQRQRLVTGKATRPCQVLQSDLQLRRGFMSCSREQYNVFSLQLGPSSVV